MLNESPKPTFEQPTIWEYVEPTEFLKAHYQARKARQESFSFAVWAQEMGIKSRSFLRLVLIGKRSLTEDMAPLFAQNLKLNKSESLYFHHLVGLQRATQLQTKEYHSREISKLRSKFLLKKHSLLEVNRNDLFDFLASYQIPRLQVLLTLEEVNKTAENLARLLKMKESEVQSHLKNLQKLGLAELDQNTQQWRAIETQIGTPDSLGNIALQSFHRKSLEEAIQGLSLPKESRRYQSLVMALTEDQFQELHQDLRQTLEACLQKFETQKNQTKKVYQINLNIIPVTGSIDHSSSSEAAVSEPTKKEHES
jgi:uncharacterized protein (TIGR02147 family)